MRTLSKSRNHFYGTHKGYSIEIERERPPVESFGLRHFYIRVYNDYGHAYDGYSPADVTTLAEAKREALYGAKLKARPDPAQAKGDMGSSLVESAVSQGDTPAQSPAGGEG